MPFKRQLVFIFFVIIFLIPKIYYLTLAYNNNNYSESKIYNSADEAHYLAIAKSLSKYGVYTDNNSNIQTERATWRPPIWPLILASFFTITTNLFALVMLKFILEFGLILLAWFWFKKQNKSKLNYSFPFLLLLLEPQYIKYSLTFLSESITAVFCLLLVTCFVLFCKSKKNSLSIIIFSLLVILCHPVSAFFVAFLLLFYGLLNFKNHFLRIILHAFIFISVFSIWPFCNDLAFDKGFYLTASQGTTFSKGWNSKVALEFNNCEGDLADEGLNLNLLNSDDKVLENLSYIDRSKQYKRATLIFLSSISLNEKITIALTKLKSNFNPFLEKEKDIFLEKIAIPFRILYIFIFIQSFYLLLFRKPKQLEANVYRACLSVLAIVLGQTFMAIYIYTGLRFNAIYGLSMLFLAIIINYKSISKTVGVIGFKTKLFNL